MSIKLKTKNSVSNDSSHGLLLECESEDEYCEHTEKNTHEYPKNDINSRSAKNSCLKTIEIQFNNSEKEHSSNPKTKNSSTSSDIEVSCASKSVNTSNDQVERPKLLAKFKLISSSCSKPCTFEYSIKLEEKTKQKSSLRDQKPSEYQQIAQKCKMRDEKINMNRVVLLNSLARVDGLGYKDLDQKVFLNIKPLPLVWFKSSDLSKCLLKLEKSIEKSDFNSNPFRWMVKRRLILPPSCSNCKQVMNISDEDAYDDGIEKFWVCGCGNMKSMTLPTAFSGIKSLRKIASLIYCWSTRDENVETTLGVYQEHLIKDAYLMYTSLQSLCGRIISRDRTRLASFDGYPVEILTVQIGNIYILAAMETKTKAIRLASFDKNDIIKNSTSKINPFVDTCRKWIAIPSQLQIFEKKFQNLNSFGYTLVYCTKKDFQRQDALSNEENAGGYLILHLQKMFKNINLNTLDPYSMEFILNELEWREKYGYDPYTAFKNIVTHLATDPIKSDTVPVRPTVDTNSILVDDDWLIKNWKNCTLDNANETDYQLQLSESNKCASYAESGATKVDEYYVDEFYYGWWFPSSYIEKFRFAKPMLDILCHLCHMNFNKASIAKHMVDHFELLRYVNSSSGFRINEICGHCLKSYTPKQMHLHKELISTKMIRFSCRICCLSYCQREEFLDHMRKNHWPREAPYVCHICRYRSSFQKDIFTHFDECHNETETIICHICLKIIDYDNILQISELIHNHIADHFKSGSFFSCPRCTLTFLNESHKQNHLKNDHGDPAQFLQTSEFIPFRLCEKELLCSTISSRIELYSSSENIQRLTLNKKKYEDKTDKLRIETKKTKRLSYRIIEKLCHSTRLICLECRNRIEEKHFTQRAVFCRSCGLKTYCRAKAKRHPCQFSIRSQNYIPKDENRYQCFCGSLRKNINDLAKHMAISKHYTCKYVRS